MQTGARYQAILDLITLIYEDKNPADNVINDYMRRRKYIGSKDRRFITDYVWDMIRNRMKYSFNAGSTFARKVFLYTLRDKLDAAFDGSTYGLQPLSDDEKIWMQSFNDDVYPDYVEAECPEWIFKKNPNLEFFKALNRPANADFRVNFKSQSEVAQAMEKEGFSLVPTPFSSIGLRSFDRINLSNCIAYKEGMFEVQDEASQIAAILCDAKPELKIVDYCSGAGGKSLTLSHLMKNQGKILAHDISSKRLENIKTRLKRLSVENIEMTDYLAVTDRNFDRFVLDCPCSGTGTWRRSPDAKFRLSEKMLAKLNETQSELLALAADKTRVGGRIIYITCSVLADENEHIVDKFIAQNENYSFVDIKALWERKFNVPYPHNSEKYLRMSPLTTNTDGFFISILERKS